MFDLHEPDVGEDGGHDLNQYKWRQASITAFVQYAKCVCVVQKWKYITYFVDVHSFSPVVQNCQNAFSHMSIYREVVQNSVAQWLVL